MKVGLGETIDPRNHTNEHENLVMIFRRISWIVFDFPAYLTDKQVKKMNLGH
jgi:hypothetical protein